MNVMDESGDQVYDYLFEVDNDGGIMEVYELLLKNPLFKKISDDDRAVLIDKFQTIIKNLHELPGFIIIKIDTSTEMVYVNYYKKSIFNR